MKNVGFHRNKLKQFFIKTQYISGYSSIFRSYIKLTGLDSTYNITMPKVWHKSLFIDTSGKTLQVRPSSLSALVFRTTCTTL